MKGRDAIRAARASIRKKPAPALAELARLLVQSPTPGHKATARVAYALALALESKAPDEALRELDAWARKRLAPPGVVAEYRSRGRAPLVEEHAGGRFGGFATYGSRDRVAFARALERWFAQVMPQGEARSRGRAWQAWCDRIAWPAAFVIMQARAVVGDPRRWDDGLDEAIASKLRQVKTQQTAARLARAAMRGWGWTTAEVAKAWARA